MHRWFPLSQSTYLGAYPSKTVLLIEYNWLIFNEKLIV